MRFDEWNLDTVPWSREPQVAIAWEALRILRQRRSEEFDNLEDASRTIFSSGFIACLDKLRET